MLSEESVIDGPVDKLSVASPGAMSFARRRALTSAQLSGRKRAPSQPVGPFRSWPSVRGRPAPVCRKLTAIIFRARPVPNVHSPITPQMMRPPAFPAGSLV